MIESKAKILTAASELFASAGAGALSVRAISKRAGLSTIGIYNHFNGKQGILDALYIEGFQMVMTAIRVEDETLSPREAVLQGLSNYIDLATEHRGHTAERSDKICDWHDGGVPRQPCRGGAVAEDAPGVQRPGW